jgi:small subunit ribosomal protein S6
MAAPQAEYELVLMLDPETPDERRDAIAADARQRIESGGALKHDNSWGLRKMAYEIDRRTEADYRFFRFESGGTPLLDELNHNLRIADGVLRFRLFKVDPRVPVIVPPPPSPLSSGRPERPERGRRDGQSRGRGDGPPRSRGADDEPVAAPVEPVEAPPVKEAAVEAPAAAPAEPAPVEAAPAEAQPPPPAASEEAPAAPEAEAPPVPAEPAAAEPEAPAPPDAPAEAEAPPADDQS